MRGKERPIYNIDSGVAASAALAWREREGCDGKYQIDVKMSNSSSLCHQIRLRGKKRNVGIK